MDVFVQNFPQPGANCRSRRAAEMNHAGVATAKERYFLNEIESG
jgi:hypothetical protein